MRTRAWIVALAALPACTLPLAALSNLRASPATGITATPDPGATAAAAGAPPTATPAALPDPTAAQELTATPEPTGTPGPTPTPTPQPTPTPADPYFPFFEGHEITVKLAERALTADSIRFFALKPAHHGILEGVPLGVGAEVAPAGDLRLNILVTNSDLAEDIRTRLFEVAWEADGQTVVLRFKFAKAIEAAHLAPGEPITHEKLPAPQTVLRSEIQDVSTATYASLAAAKAGEGYMEP